MAALIAALAATAGCSKAATECETYLDCDGKYTEVICIRGECVKFGSGAGTGDIDVSLEVPRRSRIEHKIKSVKLFIFERENSDESPLSCGWFDAGGGADEPKLNALRVSESNLMGYDQTNFFQTRISLVPAGKERLLYVEGYPELDETGAVIGKGCEDGIEIMEGASSSQHVVFKEEG